MPRQKTELKKVSEEPSPIITVTFQTVLNRNLIRATDALNDGDLWGCLQTLRTTIGLLKKEHSKPLLENEVAHIDAEINKAMGITRFDLYWTRRTQNVAVKRILQRELYPLFRKLTDLLHTKGYLEKKPVQPRAKGSGRLRIE